MQSVILLCLLGASGGVAARSADGAQGAAFETAARVDFGDVHKLAAAAVRGAALDGPRSIKVFPCYVTGDEKSDVHTVRASSTDHFAGVDMDACAVPRKDDVVNICRPLEAVGSSEAGCDDALEVIEGDIRDALAFNKEYFPETIENTSRYDHSGACADMEEILVLRRRGQRRVRLCCVPRGCRRLLHDLRQSSKEPREDEALRTPSETMCPLNRKFTAAVVVCLSLESEFAERTGASQLVYTYAGPAAVGAAVGAAVACLYYNRAAIWTYCCPAPQPADPASLLQSLADDVDTPPPISQDFDEPDETPPDNQGVQAMLGAAARQEVAEGLVDIMGVNAAGATPGHAAGTPLQGGDHDAQTPPDTLTPPGDQGLGAILGAAAHIEGGAEELQGVLGDNAAGAPPSHAATPPRTSDRARTKPSKKKSSGATSGGLWTEAEDAALDQFLETNGTQWKANEAELKKRLPGRTLSACRNRWNDIKPDDATPSRPRPSTKPADVIARLSAAAQGAASDVTDRRAEFGDAPTPAQKGVLAALELVRQRVDTALDKYRWLRRKYGALQKAQTRRRSKATTISKATVTYEAARQAYSCAQKNMTNGQKDALALIDKHLLDVARNKAGPTPSTAKRKALDELETKAKKSREATDGANHSSREASLNEAAKDALAVRDAAYAAHQRSPSPRTRKALKDAQAAYDVALGKTPAGRQQGRAAKKHEDEVRAAAAIERTRPREILSKTAAEGDEAKAYALGEIRRGRRVYIGNSTAGNWEEEMKKVLRRPGFLLKKKRSGGVDPIQWSRLEMKSFSCGTSAVVANLAERHAQIAVRNERGAGDILSSKAGAGGIHCKHVEVVVYVFSIKVMRGDVSTSSPFVCGEHDLSDLQQAVVAAAKADPMPTRPVSGDVEFHLKKVGGEGVYHAFTRGSWCVRQWKPRPGSPYESEIVRLWPSVDQAEARAVKTTKTHVDYPNGYYEEVEEGEYTPGPMDTPGGL